MSKTLLSILSHVAHGYVGNRACVFPLQCCDWDVDAVHTTEYLNHPGHGTFQGAKNDGPSIKTIIEGLKALFDIGTHYDVIVVGYCPSAELMSAVYEELTPIYNNAASKHPVFVVDPVLGDNGRLYVPEEVVQVHIDFLKLGFVDLTTPNQFEMELLTGIKLHTWTDVKLAAKTFHEEYKIENFVVLSVRIDSKLYCVGFSAKADHVFCIPIEEINCRFSGCGDIFTALLTDEFYANDRCLTPKVLGLVVEKLHQILVTSFEDERDRLAHEPEIVHDIKLVRLRDVFNKRLGNGLDVKFL